MDRYNRKRAHKELADKLEAPSENRVRWRQLDLLASLDASKSAARSIPQWSILKALTESLPECVKNYRCVASNFATGIDMLLRSTKIRCY